MTAQELYALYAGANINQNCMVESFDMLDQLGVRMWSHMAKRLQPKESDMKLRGTQTGTNIPSRLQAIQLAIENGDNIEARRQIRELLKLIPVTKPKAKQ